MKVVTFINKFPAIRYVSSVAVFWKRPLIPKARGNTPISLTLTSSHLAAAEKDDDPKGHKS